MTAAAVTLVFSLPAAAFTLTPMNASFDPEGAGATQPFVLDNDSREKLPIQVSMAERKIDENGVETNPEADDKFEVYPPQLVLGPGERRTVRVTWTGDRKPARELAYRIIAEQLPVETEKRRQTKGLQINILLRYVGAVYIVPKDAKPDVALSQAAPGPSDAGKILLVFENRGTAHKILKGLHVTLETSRKVTLGPAELKGLNEQNLLSGAKRRALLAWPASLPKGQLKASFELKE